MQSTVPAVYDRSTVNSISTIVGKVSSNIIAASSAADSYAKAEKSERTRKAYELQLRQFATWCESAGVGFVPATSDTVAAHLAALAEAGKSTSTIMVRLAAIAYAHRQLGFDDPTTAERVKAVLRGIRRTIGTAPKQKAPATAKFIKGDAEGVARHHPGQA